MTDSISERVLNFFSLNGPQRTAAQVRGRDVAVTAGAGSGKTRTLVARYTCLLAEGVEPRRIAAVTFTDKAAMQMRSKVRESLSELERQAQDPEERQKWSVLSAQIDSARIGTIHSLCAEILRNHPAEAGVDPRFEVLDEGPSAALRQQAAEDTLNQLVEDEKFMPLLANIPLRDLKQLLNDLLDKRFDAQEIFEKKVDNRMLVTNELKARMNKPPIPDLIHELRGMSPNDLLRNAGDKLANAVYELLRCWSLAETALAENKPTECAAYLYDARRSYLNKTVGKAGPVKEIISELQECFDLHINPLTGGKDSKDPQPSVGAEEFFESLLPLLHDAFNLVHQAYKDMLQKRQVLDFDDLEFYAQQLLKREEIRQRWQQELDTVMVDEYQDTNQRQRDIVNALAGKRGCLFMVGDMRQSIYRFRNADVTVFRDEQTRIKRENGLLVNLDITYRQHEPLLNVMADILAKAIGTEEDPARKYYVPFTPMVAYTKEQPDHIQPPHVEFIIGIGSDTPTARPVAAQALVSRLLELKQEGQIEKWDDVALLFRASTGFPYYEEALEEAGIPFVTVAGRGFYDRPEIRDLLNILRTLSDPFDDLAFAGLLRSPAFGLSDAALYQLRSSKLHYWDALRGDLSTLSEEIQSRARRTLDILNALLPIVDRIPVAELLQQLVNATDYRAILATADVVVKEKKASTSGGRLWRNVDKLLNDTRMSRAVNVRDFLEILTSLDDAGAREGEAPAEADGSVRLMTIHKAKGLEFPVVVLADSSRGVRSPSELVYLSNELGVTFKLDPPPMLYTLAKIATKDQDECEELRLLYVALTRAQHKLIISGHATINDKEELSLKGWTKLLDEAAGTPSFHFSYNKEVPFEISTHQHYPVRAWFTQTVPLLAQVSAQALVPESQLAVDLPSLYQPIDGSGQAEAENELDLLIERQSWQVFQMDEKLSGNVLGSIVHKAIQRWLFPGDPGLNALLEMETYNAGLVSDKLRQIAINRATELLTRLRKHPLWEEIDTALERYSELPYVYTLQDKLESRVIDLLYRNTSGWYLLDFKTDSIGSLAEKEKLVQCYTAQVRRYAHVTQLQLKQPVQAKLCFLDDQGKVAIVEI